MILVDTRVGSKDLIVPLRKMGLEVEGTRLEYADVAFTGRGSNATTLDIGVELKVLGDLVGSLRSGRLAGHQLPGLLRTYEYAWVVVEGLWSADPRGRLTGWRKRSWAVLPGKMSAMELEKQMLTLDLCGGLRVRYTPTRADTLRFLRALYHWWTDRALDQHTSHLAMHAPPTLLEMSPFRQVVAGFPGVGVKLSRAVERHFGGSLVRAVAASTEEWAHISVTDASGKVRRLGPKLAHSIVMFMQGPHTP